MRKKLIMLGLSVCLLASACNGKNAQKDSDSSQNKKNAAEQAEDGGHTEKDEGQTAKKDNSQTDNSKEQKLDKNQTVEPEQALSKVPEVTFTDYSQNIEDEAGVIMLSVTENCPVISIEENQDIAEKMNMVFEQQHTSSQENIQKDLETAKEAYKGLSKEEAAAWNGYGYGISYKVMYASTRILSIVAESYEWQGTPHPNTWTSSYCFDVTTGSLLYLSDIFTDSAKAKKIVEQHILDTVTKDPYKDALLEDYESYVSDVMTEDTFYLNEKGLVVICNPYMVTSYATGIIEIEIPYSDLKDVMNEAFIQEEE